MKMVTDEERADNVAAQGSGVSTLVSNSEWFEMMNRRTPPPPCHEDCFLHRFGSIDSTMLYVTGLITLDQATKCPLDITPAKTQPAPAAPEECDDSPKPDATTLSDTDKARREGTTRLFINAALDAALLQYRPTCRTGCYAHRFPSNTLRFLRTQGAISEEEKDPCDNVHTAHPTDDQSARLYEEWVQTNQALNRVIHDVDAEPEDIAPTRLVRPVYTRNGLVHPGKVRPIPPRKRVDAEFKRMAQPKEHEEKYTGSPIIIPQKAPTPEDGLIPDNLILGPIFLLAQLWRNFAAFFSTATKKGKARKSKALLFDIIANVLAIVVALSVFAFGIHMFVLCQPVAQPMRTIDTCTPLGPGDAGKVVRLDGNGCAYWSFVDALSAQQANPWSKDFHAYPHEVTQGLRSEEQNIRQPFNNEGVKAKEMQEIRLDLLGDNGIDAPPLRNRETVTLVGLSYGSPLGECDTARRLPDLHVNLPDNRITPPIDGKIGGKIVMCGSDRTGKRHVNLPDNRITPPIDGKIILCETPDHHGNQKCTEVTHLDDIARHYTTKEEQEEEEHTLKTFIRNIFGRAVV